LLEAGVHFGHQTRRWNPKMKEYIFGENATASTLSIFRNPQDVREASRFVSELSGRAENVLFVAPAAGSGSGPPKRRSARCVFVNHRWLGGTLTNWATLQKSIIRLKLLKAMNEEWPHQRALQERASALDREMKHLFQNLEGIENMNPIAGRHVS